MVYGGHIGGHFEDIYPGMASPQLKDIVCQIWLQKTQQFRRSIRTDRATDKTKSMPHYFKKINHKGPFTAIKSGVGKV